MPRDTGARFDRWQAHGPGGVTLLGKFFGAASRQPRQSWRTRRRIIVIESDGWGAIRMPSRAVYERCLRAGYRVDQTVHERYDSLLSDDDLELLFGFLAGFRDQKGRTPVITANTVSGNPNFDAIAAEQCRNYHWEPLAQTFSRYPRHARALALWERAMAQGLLHPQFHGREHVNVAAFMSGLQARDPAAIFALANRMPGCIPKGARAAATPYLGPTHFQTEEEKQAVLQAILEGLDAFEAQFGFRARSLSLPQDIWSTDFDRPVARAGVEAFQGGPIRHEPRADGDDVRTKRYLGARNALGQTDLVRNVVFEPAFSAGHAQGSAVQALGQIREAFRKRQPAIISCQRVNFCGFIDPANRDRTLAALDFLLRAILAKWPDVEFMHSVELLDLMRHGDHRPVSARA